MALRAFGTSASLLQSIEGEPPYTMLDFGCGPGRDLKMFAELGDVAIGLETAEHFVEMARAHGGCEVWQHDFLKFRFQPRKALSVQRFLQQDRPNADF